MTQLPKPKARIPVAVYGFRDQTGQFKTSPESSYSTLVTQGAATILIKALEDSGWYIAVEREGLQNLLTERRIIRAIESPAEKGKPIINLPNMMPASIIIEGGVIAYESNVRTGGKGANYLGIGASTQYRVDQVTVSLRSIDVRYGQVLNSVSVTKTIYSYQFSANVFKYTSYQHLLQGETGFATNEPAQLAVREAIEAAVVHLTVNGIRDRYLELQDASTWFSPVIQSYMAEALGNIGEEPLEDDAMIPMRPNNNAFREPVQPLPFGVEPPQAPPRTRERAPAASPAPSTQAVPGPVAAPVAVAAVSTATPTPTPTPASTVTQPRAPAQAAVQGNVGPTAQSQVAGNKPPQVAAPMPQAANNKSASAPVKQASPVQPALAPAVLAATAPAAVPTPRPGVVPASVPSAAANSRAAPASASASAPALPPTQAPTSTPAQRAAPTTAQAPVPTAAATPKPAPAPVPVPVPVPVVAAQAQSSVTSSSTAATSSLTPSATSANAPIAPKPASAAVSSQVIQPESQKPTGKEDIFNLYWKSR
ncbi:CsgG/HfaB family protein [Paucibacter sp. TC2R-5]|uniref:CsgG/HfaB family protein n=1 Tax=Paucibacter sp. TC2R-5 TaxID=2893555 RepID=UPI0021E36EDD|nr:CsgG/HfaB family protein [Paucibacter sp. TC2R-5]